MEEIKGKILTDAYNLLEELQNNYYKSDMSFHDSINKIQDLLNRIETISGVSSLKRGST